MATILKAHKIRLYPTPEQEAYFRRAAGTRRFIYNWGLAEWQRQYAAFKAKQQPKPPTADSLKKEFNAIREKDFPWTYAVTKCVVEGAFADLSKAYSNFFARRAKYPRWKHKGKSRDAFYIANDKFVLQDHRIQVPVLGDFLVKQRELQGDKIVKRKQQKRAAGWVDMAENLRFVTGHIPIAMEKPRHTRKVVVCSRVKILGATIGREADGWYASMQVEIDQDIPAVVGPPVGIDLGFLRLATLSTDERFDNQKPLRRLLTQLRFLNKQLARRTKGSKNFQKTKQRLARLHQRIACMRDDSHHKIAYDLAEHFGFIGMEDLNVKGMLQNHKRALSAADASLGKLARYIETKAGRHGTTVQRVSRWFPSTKRCHRCHHEREIAESERIYVCLNADCQWQGDRDWNAALNILEEALRLVGLVA